MNNLWWNQSIFGRIFSGFLVIILLMAISGVFGFYYTGQVGALGITAGLETSPTHDSTMEMQLRVLEAHLALEEVLSGSKTIQYEKDVHLKYQRALEIAFILLQGGRNGTVEVLPVKDPAIRDTVETFRNKITLLSQHSRDLYDAYRISFATGSSADIKFNEVYHQLQNKLQQIQASGMQGQELSLLDRLADIRYLVADNHLFLEELLNGAPNYDFNHVIKVFNEVSEHLSQMPALKEGDARELKELFKDIKDLSYDRYDHSQQRKDRMTSASQSVDDAYNNFSSESHSVELILEKTLVESMDSLKKGVEQSRQAMLMVIALGVISGILLAWLLARGMSGPVLNMTTTMHGIAESGDFSKRLDIQGRDELAIMAATFNQMAEKTQGQKWLQENSVAIATLVQQAKSHNELCQTVLGELVNVLSLATGAFLVLNGPTGRFQVKGSFGTNGDIVSEYSFAMGEGLIGQSALDNRLRILEELPPEYLRLHSALGDALPAHLLVAPVAHKGTVLAVLELASFHSFKPRDLALMDNILPTLALGLEGLNRLYQTEELLEEAQRQAEELELQQEELRSNNESLRDQSQKLEESELELRTQQEELRTANEDLELKTASLEMSTQELEKAHQELVEKAANLEQASQYKSEFLANMSHELRTPLNSLLILSKLFAQNEKENLTEEQLESAKIIYESGQDLLSLINDILDLAKIEAGRADIRPDDLNVSSFVEKLQKNFQPMAAQKGIGFNIVVEPGFSESFYTDPQKVEQVVRNLLSNAIKFTDSGQVELTFFVPTKGQMLANIPVLDNILALKVQDTGIGIPPDKRNIIFDAFQQVDGSTSRMFGGTGLGLSISRELSRLLGGEILVESQLGQGSTFFLILPVSLKDRRRTLVQRINKPKAVAPAPPPKEIASTVTTMVEVQPALDDRDIIDPRDLVVLVIEDDPNFFAIVSRIAHKKGYKCLNAPNGQIGIDMVSRYSLIGVVLDPGLPDMDGLEVLKRIKDNPYTSHVPVHIISAREFGNEILSNGAIGALHKPVSVEQINDVCKKFEATAGRRVRQVLLAEDDPLSAKATSALIQRKNAQVTVVTSGQAVIECLRSKHFDCLILDLGLSDMSGFDLLDRLADENLPTVPPVIVYSGKDLNKEEHQKLRESTASIIVKGVESADRLLEEVSLFLHSVQQTLPLDKRAQLPWVGGGDEALLQGKTVLVVDDDMRNTFALKRILTLKGVHVMVAANGQKALDLLASHGHEINLVLMDIMMPVMDGHEAILHIRKQARFQLLPIIVLSAKAMLEDRVRCLEAGANDFLPKPVDVERLYSLLRVWFFT